MSTTRLCRSHRLQKARAYRIYREALRIDQLIRKPCEVCGDPHSQGHHRDYTKPLEVVWLCRKHHAREHSVNGRPGAICYEISPRKIQSALRWYTRGVNCTKIAQVFHVSPAGMCRVITRYASAKQHKQFANAFNKRTSR